MVRCVAGLLLLGMNVTAQTPAGSGYWPAEKAREVLDKTRTIRLAPEGSGLTAGERVAVAHLIEVGKSFQAVYEEQLHPQAAEARYLLAKLRPPRPDLESLHRLFKGPIATTLCPRLIRAAGPGA